MEDREERDLPVVPVKREDEEEWVREKDTQDRTWPPSTIETKDAHRT